MKSIFYRSILFSLPLIFFFCLPSVGQVLTFKSGSVIEKRILRGQIQEIQVINPRGDLHWQQSKDGANWTNWPGKTEMNVIVLVNEYLFLRCAIQEANCDPVYSEVVKLIPYDLATVSTTTITEIQKRSAAGGGIVENDGGDPVQQKGVCWSINMYPTIIDSKTSDGTGTGSYSSILTGLIPGTVYFARAYAINNAGTAYGNQVSFTTEYDVTLPSISTSTITGITSTTAAGGGIVTHDGNAPVTARGISWSTNHNPTTANSKTTDGIGIGVFTSSLTGLTGNTTYYVRAYCTNSAGTSYGNEVGFKTSPVLPTVTTAAVSSITQTTAISGGNASSDGGANITARGVCWSTLSNPTIADSKTTDGAGTGTFTSSLSDLAGNTTYYVRAYCINSAGTGYGSEINFKTSPVLPTITTAAVSSIDQTTATSGGNVTNDGGAGITARGVCWSTLSNPAISDNKTTDGTGSGSFISTLTNLTGNTTYYLRAWCTNIAGTSYGHEISFKTSPVLPEVTTTAVSSITPTSAISGGNATSNGGAEITTRGVCWSTLSNPTTADSKTSDGAGTGLFTSHLSGLSGNTTYYVRAYCINIAGTGYGSEISFVTGPVLPEVTTAAVTDITQTTAISGGNVISDGGGIIVRGVCWSTSSNPTTANNKTTDGARTGPFISSLTGLTGNTTYYLRAYATNNAGTSYGNEIIFITSPVLPTVTTTAIADITQTSASSGGTVISDGGADITARGVCWSNTNSIPTISDTKTTDGTGSGSYRSSLTNLTGNTTYYVRAYCTSIAGTSYGSEISFKTSPVLPTVITTSITDITSNSAASGGTVISDGGAEVTARGVCWSGITSNPTIYDTKTTDGAGSGSYRSSLTNLTGNTTYYVRAYCTSIAGTSYGNEISFNTSQILMTVTTTPVSNITATTASSGGYVSSPDGAGIIARGVCWATDTDSPTTDHPKTIDGTGSGSFTSLVTDLFSNTRYFVRAYVTNSDGTTYGNSIIFTTSTVQVTVTTTDVFDITQSTATSGGHITNEAGADIFARGVCWSTSSNPTTSNSKTIDGTGTGSFTSSISGLSAGTTYYVRAYATNSVTTYYGGQVSFTTMLGANCDGIFTDSRDGHRYCYKIIGTQTWMLGNLAYLPSVSPSSAGSDYWPYYYVYNNLGNSVSEAKATANYATYGVLYNWEAAKTACPSGWHLPSDAEWTVLINHLGASAGGKMKETGTAHWLGPNTAATNESGFTAVPGGHRYYDGGFYELGNTADFWSSAPHESASAWYKGLFFNFEGATWYFKSNSYGFSVRCIMD